MPTLKENVKQSQNAARVALQAIQQTVVQAGDRAASPSLRSAEKKIASAVQDLNTARSRVS